MAVTYRHIHVITNGDMSADITSDIVDLSKEILAGCQAVFTGSPVGVINLQCSNDRLTWTDIADSSVNVNGASNVYWNVKNISFPHLRIFYDFTSGTGTLNAIITPKGF